MFLQFKLLLIKKIFTGWRDCWRSMRTSVWLLSSNIKVGLGVNTYIPRIGRMNTRGSWEFTGQVTTAVSLKFSGRPCLETRRQRIIEFPQACTHGHAHTSTHMILIHFIVKLIFYYLYFHSENSIIQIWKHLCHICILSSVTFISLLYTPFLWLIHCSIISTFSPVFTTLY